MHQISARLLVRAQPGVPFLSMRFENKKVIVASGYFDPLHIGHVEYLKLARMLGDMLVVIVNNDKQAALKKGKSFMSENDRWRLVGELKCVDIPVLSIDDGASVSDTIQMLVDKGFNPAIFAKGGDRFSNEIPEAQVCKKHNIQIVDGLGDKIRSSSELISNAYESRLQVCA